MNRRTLFGGLLGILAAPAVIRTPGLLMPVRVALDVMPNDFWTLYVHGTRVARHPARRGHRTTTVPCMCGCNMQK